MKRWLKEITETVAGFAAIAGLYAVLMLGVWIAYKPE